MKRIILCLLVIAIFSGVASANSVKLVGGQALIYNDANKVIATLGDTNDAYFTNYVVINDVLFVGGDGGLFSYDMNTAASIEAWPGGGSAGQVNALAYSQAAKLLAVGYEEDIELMSCANNRNVEPVSWIFTGYMPTDLEFKGSKLYTDVYIYECSNTLKPRCINPPAQVFVYDNVGTWATERINIDTSDSEVPQVIGFGWKGCEPVVGDWNGDGVNEVGLYNRPGNNFIIPDVTSEAGYKIIGLGWSGVKPIVGDWDADGADEVGVYNNAGTWVLDGIGEVGFGWPGPEPVVGDWNGDGADEVGLYNRPGNNWLVRYSQDKYNVIGLGWAGVKTLVGNIDSDKYDEVIVYDPASATFVSNDGYQKTFGQKNSQPILGDINGNRIDEIGAIYPDGTIHYNVPQATAIELVQWPKSTAIAV